MCFGAGDSLLGFILAGSGAGILDLPFLQSPNSHPVSQIKSEHLLTEELALVGVAVGSGPGILETSED